MLDKTTVNKIRTSFNPPDEELYDKASQCGVLLSVGTTKGCKLLCTNIPRSVQDVHIYRRTSAVSTMMSMREDVM